MPFGALATLPQSGLVVFFLVLVRASAIFLSAPLLGNRSVPMRVKVGLALLLSLLWTPFLMGKAGAPNPQDLWVFAAAVVSEVAVGLLIGTVTNFFFTAAQFAGYAVGMQMGFGMASMFDPTTQSQSSVVGQFYLFAATLVFLLLDGHHWILIALGRSFDAVPLGGFAWSGQTTVQLIDAANNVFWVALMLAAPVLGVLILAELAMGIVARIMPQMNVFVASFPVKILLGVFTLFVSFPILVASLGSQVELTFERVLALLGIAP